MCYYSPLFLFGGIDGGTGDLARKVNVTFYPPIITRSGIVPENKKSLRELINNLAQNLAQEYESDVYGFCGGLYDPNVDDFILKVRKNHSSKNCILFLTTNGGSPDAAFRLIRILKRYYHNDGGKIRLYVLGWCKSAGTLIALGADEIVMGDFGEFGPLDVQMRKEDHLSMNESGLNYAECTKQLYEQLYYCFQQSFIEMAEQFAFSTQTAADIASKLTVGFFSPISKQIHPIKLAETRRAMEIAEDYGKRIITGNDQEIEIINKLIREYHAHSFVIDYEEAKKLFGEKKVCRLESQIEKELENVLLPLFRMPPQRQNQAIVEYFQTNNNQQENIVPSPKATTMMPDEESESSDETQPERQKDTDHEYKNTSTTDANDNNQSTFNDNEA